MGPEAAKGHLVQVVGEGGDMMDRTRARRRERLEAGKIGVKVVLFTEHGLTSVTVWLEHMEELRQFMSWVAGPRDEAFVSVSGEFAFPPTAPVLYAVRGA